MKNQDNEKSRFTVRLSSEERGRLKEWANAANISESEYCRALLHGMQPQPKQEISNIARLLCQHHNLCLENIQDKTALVSLFTWEAEAWQHLK